MENNNKHITHDRKDYHYKKEEYKPRFQKREREFKGYYVDVTQAGGDAIRAFRKLKRMYKDTGFFEEMREREHYRKPSEIKRERGKKKRQTLHRLQRDRDALMGTLKKRKK